ncbi:MAG: hypothetical protein ACRD3G_30950, partial [Vicinamibacterales bacterium]
LEKMASKRRARATVPIALYPLQALLKLAGSAAVRRQRRRPRAAAPPHSSDPAQARGGDQVADVPTTKAG